jgi:hypothetical protein
MWEGRVLERVFLGKPEGKRAMGRLELGWEDDIKMNIQEVGRGRMD